jgi:hypothetical protein
LANPYPCDINWDAGAGAWTKPTSMQDAWYRWNALGTGYGVYQSSIYAGALPAPSNPNIIPSGQGFFVRLVDPGIYNATLTVRENAKSTSTSGGFSRISTSSELLKIRLNQVGNTDDYAYECVIRFMDNATDGFDPQLDLFSLGSNRFYFGIEVDNQQTVVGSFAPITENKIIPLNSYFYGQQGQYTFNFSNLSSFQPDVYIYLKDNSSGEIIDVKANPLVTFSVNGSNINMTNRFELVFGITAVVGVKENVKSGSLILAPNPSEGGNFDLILDEISGNGKVEVFDVTGRLVFTNRIFQTVSQIKTGLPSGIYRLTYSDAKGLKQKALVVK